MTDSISGRRASQTHMKSMLTNADPLTKIQYGLMVVFGTLTAAVSFAPLGMELRIMGAGTLFGVTVGLWLSHLLTMTYTATQTLRQGAGSNA